MISSGSLLSEKTIAKLRKAGHKPKLKTKRIELVPANEEVGQLAVALLPNTILDFSGLPKLNFSDFRYLSKLYEHSEEKMNLRKLLALFGDIRDRIMAKRKKTEEPRKKGYVQ
ncbi:hypothetical protein L0152_07220 [bacterium]|nr:hypothetical protein [bacterium]